MALGVGVRVGVGDARAGSSLLPVGADGGECGCEVLEGPLQRGTRVSDGVGDELHFSQELLESRDEGGVFLGLLREFGIAAEVFAEFDFHENECALHFVDIGQIRVGSGWYSSGIYGV